MTHLIGITGLKCSGKDTLAECLMDVLPRSKYANLRYSFANPIYRMIEVLLGQKHMPTLDNGEYDKSSMIEPYGVTLRTLLQTLGTEWGRNMVHNEVWVLNAEQWLARVAASAPATRYILFTDIRFPNEVRFIRNQGGTVVQVVRSATGRSDNHESERGIPAFMVDKVVDNNGTMEELQLLSAGLAYDLECRARG